MRRSLTTLALTCTLLLAAPVGAQAQKDPKQAIDDLITCTLIYSRTADLYAEQGNTAKSEEFQSTTYAYGVVADSVTAVTYGEEIAEDYVDERMNLVMQALNTQAEQRSGGDVDVIAEWLDYCDEMGPRVQQVLDRIDF